MKSTLSYPAKKQTNKHGWNHCSYINSTLTRPCSGLLCYGALESLFIIIITTTIIVKLWRM